MSSFPRLLRLLLALSLIVSAVLYVGWSLHWPLVGDAALLHYHAFLISQGLAPYRDFIDMNMPGSFLIELGAMKLFGPGAVAWRMFDLSLLLVAAGSFHVLTRRAGWLPCVFAGALFALVHGRDGLVQGGQRDLTMAVLLVASTAALATALRGRKLWAMAVFGFCAGIALTIKPTALPLTLAQLAIATWVWRSRAEGWGARAVASVAGLLVMPCVCVALLAERRALPEFWQSLTGLDPYYASLGHRPPGFLLQHSLSPVLPLCLVWLVVVVLARPRLDWERGLLLAGLAFGMISYLVQARGFPYYRYPLLVFLLPLVALDCVEAWHTRGGEALRQRVASLLAVAALCFGGLFLAPQSAVLIHRYRWWESAYLTSMQQNLERLGGASLAGRVQCVDSITGCDAVLYRMRLLPATGILLDFPLFGEDNNAFVHHSRSQFRNAVFAHPPPVIVVTSPLYVDGPGDFRKLDRWPELQAFLDDYYRLETDWHPTRTERWWSREELPPSYRIYLLREVNPVIR